MRRPRPLRAAAVAVAVAVLGAAALAGCGGGRTGLSAVQQSQLLDLIGQARAADAAGRPTAALSAVTQLRTTISMLRIEGVLAPASAARMQSVAAQAQSAARAQISAAAKIAAAAAATPTPAAPTPAPPAQAAPGTDPVQIIVQGAQALRNQVQQQLDKHFGKLAEKLAKRLDGGGQGKGGGD